MTVLEEQRARLTERLAAVGTLAAGFAHELRNPLNAADLQLQLLDRRLSQAVATEQLPALLVPLELARDELARLSRLVTDFLEFARPRRLQPRDTDLCVLLRDVVARASQRARERGLELELRVPSTAVMAELDAERVKEVAFQLLRNAIDAARHHVEVAADADDAQACLRFRDDGPGIEPAHRERVFEPFFTTKAGGTGLGMSIAHSLVERHGGTIELRCVGGTEVVVKLPRRAL